MTKSAIVTGTSGNLGPIWVETLKENGWSVFGIDLPDYNVANKGSVLCAWVEYRKHYKKGPDLIINNAAIDVPPDASPVDFWEWEQIMAVNFGGCLNICQSTLPIDHFSS